MKTTYMAFLSNLSRVFCLESINHNLCINTIQTKTIIMYVIIIPGHITVLLTFSLSNISNVSNASREQTDHITIIIRFFKTKSNFCKKKLFLKICLVTTVFCWCKCTSNTVKIQSIWKSVLFVEQKFFCPLSSDVHVPW